MYVDRLVPGLVDRDPAVGFDCHEVPAGLPEELERVPDLGWRGRDEPATVDSHLEDPRECAPIPDERDALAVGGDDGASFLVWTSAEVDAATARVDAVDLARDRRCAVGCENDRLGRGRLARGCAERDPEGYCGEHQRRLHGWRAYSSGGEASATVSVASGASVAGVSAACASGFAAPVFFRLRRRRLRLELCFGAGRFSDSASATS